MITDQQDLAVDYLLTPSSLIRPLGLFSGPPLSSSIWFELRRVTRYCSDGASRLLTVVCAISISASLHRSPARSIRRVPVSLCSPETSSQTSSEPAALRRDHHLEIGLYIILCHVCWTMLMNVMHSMLICPPIYLFPQIIRRWSDLLLRRYNKCWLSNSVSVHISAV
jgi:hypothetical protein